MTGGSAKASREEITYLRARATSSRLKTLFLGVVMAVAGVAMVVFAIFDEEPVSTRLVVGGVGLLSAGFGVFLLVAAYKMGLRQEPLLLAVSRGEGVLWYFVDPQEFENGSALLVLIDEAGTRHLWNLPSAEIDRTLALVAKLLPTAEAGFEEKLRKRLESDKEGVLRELVARRATRAAQLPLTERAI